jgi:fatty acid desaturase
MSKGGLGGGASRIEWPTMGLILFCYGAWLALGLLVWPAYPAAALLGLAVVLALQSSLMHEVSHGHPTRSARLNEVLVGLPIGLVWPFRRFKSIHLSHHADERLTDPFDDPESYYRALWQHEALPRAMQVVLSVNNTMLGRMLLNPWLGSIGFVVSDARAIMAGDRAIARAWLLHAAGLAIVLPVIHFAFAMPVWLYVLVPVWLGQAIISVRTYAEHQWSERPDGRTIIVERSPLALLFLNNNLHLVHHKMPNVAWYRLPALFAERREEWLRMNGGYVFPNYLALFAVYALRAKEPVVHPVLRRTPEPARAFRPRMRQRSVAGLGGMAAVPTEPPKD